jgi:signal transduction histidine kinase
VVDLAESSKTPSALLETPMRTLIVAPMRARGEAVGVISVFGPEGHAFRPEESALLASIAGHAAVAVQNALLQRQAERAAAQEERRRVAQEIHDSVTQSIFSLIFTIGAARKSAEQRDFDHMAETLEESEGIVRQALKDLRLLLYQLRSPLLEHEGLPQALRHRLNAVEGRAGIKTKLIAPPVLDLPPAAEEDIYRIAIEALNNALKHAKAGAIKIEVRTEGEELILLVSDDGIGFDPDDVDGNEGMGLAGMRERAARLGGSLSIESSTEAGTVVTLRVNRFVVEKTYIQV